VSCSVQAERPNSCKVVFVNCMSLRNAHSIHRSVLSSLIDGQGSLSVKQAAADVERCVTTYKTMMSVQVFILLFLYITIIIFTG